MQAVDLDNTQNALVFGASGAIGREICAHLIKDGWGIYGVSRRGQANNLSKEINQLSWDLGQTFGAEAKNTLPKFSSVIWAQGANLNDTIYDFNPGRHVDLYNANVVYIMDSLQQLLALGLIGDGARLCVISSIWQEIARQNKLSYTVTKSALRGLVQSLAIDLGPKNILVNAVLPGALDTPMTRANLTQAQIEKLQVETPLRSLPKFEDVCNLVSFLCSNKNTGLTGQFVAADRGYSHVRFI